MSSNLTWEDFQQHYKDTYFRIALPNLKMKMVVYFSEVVNEGRSRSFVAKTEKMKDLILKFDTALITDFVMPSVRMFEHEGLIYIFDRLPNRQWSRGCCSKNSRIYSPLGKAGIPHISHDFSILQSAWDHAHTPTIINAVAKLADPIQIGVTLTNHFWISEGIKDVNILLWYNSGAIGYVNTKKREIEIRFAVLAQEVQDYLFRSKQEDWHVI